MGLLYSDELDAVIGCADVPRNGTVKPDDPEFFFDSTPDPGEVSVGKFFHFEEESFPSSSFHWVLLGIHA